MPVEHQALFTLTQVEAIEKALTPRTHKLDLRMSLPLLGRGAYLVFMGGPNRRQEDRKLTQSSPAAMHAALSNDVAMGKTLQHNPTVYRMLQRVPNSIMATFQPVQIQAMEAALVPRRHLIDIRLSLPLCGKGAYLVFAAGPNRRGHYRNIQNGNHFTMPAVFASVLIGAGSILGLVYLKGSAVLAKPDPVFDQGPAFYETKVPFKKTQRECLKSGRQWIESKCIDKIHDPTF
ncbi:MAG: hypothetical protein DCF25_13325 [Leptolyngbya foveolarum]|uniref:Uncharacterized protein n=1 Tax=Leptolyngbya foveolarum TaxID=47253 RepID=A0A2W4VTL1_9CYAN|nr:MAG: hypothetical protein DCF25_13325 [Leptolyngbya foveolarum]